MTGRAIWAQVHLLAYDGFHTFDEHVIAPAATAVDADGNLGVIQQVRELDASELGAFNWS